MKTTCALLGALAAIAAHATVTVSNVSFTQDADSHDVTVTYDLATLDGEPAFVSLDVLTNGVSVGATHVKRVSGNVSTTPADTASSGAKTRMRTTGPTAKGWTTTATPSTITRFLGTSPTTKSADPPGRRRGASRPERSSAVSARERDCSSTSRPRRSGNTPAARTPPAPSTTDRPGIRAQPGTSRPLPRISPSSPGTRAMSARKPTMSRQGSRMPGGSTTSTAAYGSFAGIRRASTPRVL